MRSPLAATVCAPGETHAIWTLNELDYLVCFLYSFSVAFSQPKCTEMTPKFIHQSSYIFWSRWTFHRQAELTNIRDFLPSANFCGSFCHAPIFVDFFFFFFDIHGFLWIILQSTRFFRIFLPSTDFCRTFYHLLVFVDLFAIHRFLRIFFYPRDFCGSVCYLWTFL